MSESNTVKKDTYQNFKNEWKYTIELKMNAKGELYFGKVKMATDDPYGMVAQTYKIMREYIDMGNEKGFSWAKGLGSKGTHESSDNDED